MPAVVEVSALTKRYPGAGDDALKGVSLAVPSGSMFGLIGADGAGKSTLLRILATLIRPDRGTATVLGTDVTADAAIVRVLTGYMPQRFSLYHDLSVMENLLFFSDVFGVEGTERDTRISRLLSFARLERFTGRRAGNLSGGMKQKLSLCCALVHSPRLLILDEPTTGVDPVSRNEFWEILRELIAEQVTILVSTPYMDETRYCDHLGIMHEGRVVCEGNPQQLLSSFDKAVFRAEGVDTLPPSGNPLPSGFVRYYPGGGEIRIIAEERVAEQTVTDWLHTWCPSAPVALRTDVGMEDVFIDRISPAHGTFGANPTTHRASHP